LDRTALFKLSYGLYIIGVKDGDKYGGCVVNTVTQATASPITVTVCINKDNYTNECVKRSKEFTVSILSEHIDRGVIGVFGFSTGKDRDKFAEAPHSLTPAGLPYINKGVTGYLECRVIDFTDNFTHTVFIAEVREAENISDEPPMTYAYYHDVIKGKTPKNAPIYAGEPQAEPSGAYTCGVCGYVYPGGAEEFERLPEDYKCPVCGAVKSKFILKSGGNL